MSIVTALPDFHAKIVVVFPQFGGKCFANTFRFVDSATQLATAGFDYLNKVKRLRLLGAWTIHVSVFISVEFPDKDLVSFFKQYGQLKTENLCRLYYSNEGFSHIERGIRVAEFVSLDRDLPRKLVTQGLEIFFKYLGQPVSCYRCGSTDHVVKDCHANAVRGHESHLSRNLGERPRLLRPPPLPVMKLPWTQYLANHRTRYTTYVFQFSRYSNDPSNTIS